MNTAQDIFYTPQWARRVAEGGTAWFSGGVSAPFSMAYGNPDPALFPADCIAEAATRILADSSLSSVALQYGAIQGQPEMLGMVADKLAREEGISVTTENVIITNGASAAIGLAARALLDEGDIVLVEAPSFPGALSVFKRAGARLVNLPMGPDGIDIAATEALLQTLLSGAVRAKILYTIPTFQNPCGFTLPQSTRIALIDLAHRFNLMVIEDDAYRELHYDPADGPLPTSLYALDPDGRVIRTGTFSKILVPGMRLGWAIAQPEMIRRMLLLKEEGGTVPFSQHIAVEYAQSGALPRHIATLVAAYRAKRDAMLLALDRHFPPGVEWTRPKGGFFVWATLPPTIDPARLAALASEQGVEYLPGEACFAQPSAQPGTYLRLSFSLLPINRIDEAIARLAKVIEPLL